MVVKEVFVNVKTKNTFKYDCFPRFPSIPEKCVIHIPLKHQKRLKIVLKFTSATKQ